MHSSNSTLLSTSFWQVNLVCVLLLLSLGGCSSVSSIFGPGKEDAKPISNPFAEYRASSKGDSAQNIVLRTRKGDRAVEVEFPADTQELSDFTVPVSPAFKEGRSTASAQTSDSGSDLIDDSFKNRPPTPADREITSAFPQSVGEDGGRRSSIERSLNLAPTDEESSGEKSLSYLAALDHIKQLYRNMRYEAALMETDDLLKTFPTDSKLYQMRGTLLDRLGRRELAIKSWNQALRFDPSNESLRRFVDRKQANRVVASP